MFSLAFNWYKTCSLQVSGTNHSKDMANRMFDYEKQIWNVEQEQREMAEYPDCLDHYVCRGLRLWKSLGRWSSHSSDVCTLVLVYWVMTQTNSITVTSWWALWRLKSPASALFTQPFIRVQIKENIKAPRHWPLCGEFTGDRWISRTNGQ